MPLTTCCCSPPAGCLIMSHVRMHSYVKERQNWSPSLSRQSMQTALPGATDLLRTKGFSATAIAHSLSMCSHVKF
eukprot:scaffold268592_cov17-Tisochrysis_lutea.AAC.1